MIASDKNSLNNCTVTHITLKLHLKKTLWPFFMDTVQLQGDSLLFTTHRLTG